MVWILLVLIPPILSRHSSASCRVCSGRSSVIRGSGNFLWIAILPCSTAFHVIGLDISPNLQIHLPWPSKRNLKLVFLLSPAKNKFRDSSMAPLSYSSSYFAPLLFSGCCSDWGIFWHWMTYYLCSSCSVSRLCHVALARVRVRDFLKILLNDICCSLTAPSAQQKR